MRKMKPPDFPEALIILRFRAFFYCKKGACIWRFTTFSAANRSPGTIIRRTEGRNSVLPGFSKKYHDNMTYTIIETMKAWFLAV